MLIPRIYKSLQGLHHAYLRDWKMRVNLDPCDRDRDTVSELVTSPCSGTKQGFSVSSCKTKVYYSSIL